MLFSFDRLNKGNPIRLFLANPQKIGIGEILNPKEGAADIRLNDISELSFVVYEKSNNVIDDIYKDIKKNKLVEFKNLGWFVITDVNPSQDEVMACEKKTVKCMSLEYTLVDKHLYDIDGVYSLYDISDKENSLLHLIVANTSWKIGHVSNRLLSKYRTFSRDIVQKYNFLTTDVSKSFDCVFIFDTFSKTINAYKLDEIGELTDIVIHANNILKNYEQSESSVVTKLRVMGADGFDIREVNPTATNELINVDYFLVPISEGGWMTDGLVNGFKNYKQAKSDAQELHETNISLLDTKLLELKTLKTELNNIETQKKIYEEIQGSKLELHKNTSAMSPEEYALYLDAVNNIDILIPQELSKKAQITAKENEISAIRTTLDGIGRNLILSNFLTPEQIEELYEFLTEGEVYQDDTFVTSETTTDDEKLKMQLELMDNADKELHRISHPQITTTTTISNLFTLRDNQDSLIPLSEWRSKFDIGNLISVKFRKDFFATVRLIGMRINFDDQENIEVTLSDKSRLDNELIQMEELLANAGRTATSISLNKIGWDSASKQRNEVREFMNGTLNATTNAMHNNDRVEVEFGQYGLRNREFLPDENRYSEYQSWWNNNTLLFSSDGFKTAKTGIGLFIEEDTNEKFYGVIADVIVGNIVLTSALKIKNEANSVSIDKNGATFTDCDITINKSGNAIKLNATQGFEIFKGATRQFYIDTDGNVTSSGKINGGSININNKFTVDENGNMVAKDGEFEGKITATEGEIGSFLIDENQLVSEVSGTRFMRISTYSTAPGTNNFSTDYGAIDLGRTYDGLDTLIHLRSDGYARFGLNSLNGSIRFNLASDGEQYSLYTRYFKIKTDGIVQCNYMETLPSQDLWLVGANDMLLTTDFGDIIAHSYRGIRFIGDEFEFNDSPVLTYSNYSSYISTSAITPSLTSSGNIDFAGSVNGASVTWCNETFAKISHTHTEYSPVYHSHSSYVTNSELAALANRVSALENA